MSDTNYLGSIVKILEKPIQTIVNGKVLKTECRAQLAQIRNNTIINLVFWGILANDSINSYQINDYIMIEGYVSIPNIKNKKFVKRNLKKIQIAVLKSFPLKNF